MKSEQISINPSFSIQSFSFFQDELEEELRQMMETDEVNDLTEELLKLEPVPVKLPRSPKDEPVLPAETSKSKCYFETFSRHLKIQQFLDKFI